MAVAVVIGALVAVGYARSPARDPGLTTEIALVTTVLLGALAIREPVLASGIAVVVVILLASRTRLHRFVKRVLSEQELHDLLLLAAAALVVLPLAPDRAVGPLSVINPRTVWRLVVIFMAISGAGYIGLRLLGPGNRPRPLRLRVGLRLELGDHRGHGARARENPAVRPGAVAGAVLSTVATIIQMALLLAATSRPTLWALRWPLIFSGVAAAAYAAIFVVRSLRHRTRSKEQEGRAFHLPAAVGFAALVATVTLASAAIHQWLGERGLVLAAGVAGFADAHAAAIGGRLCRRVRPHPGRRRGDSDPGRPLDQHDHQSHARGAVAGPGLRSRGPPRAAPR